MLNSLTALVFFLSGGLGFLSLPPLPLEKPPPLLAAAPALAPENIGKRHVELTQLLEFTSPSELARDLPPLTPVSSLPDPHMRAQINLLIKKYAKRHGVDEKLVRAVLQKESGGNPAAVSPKGAMGLMQLMPETAQSLGVQDPFNPEENLAAGVKFLKYCLNTFCQNVPLALAAYNAGPETVKRYGGVPPYPETQQYVAGILGCPVEALMKKDAVAEDGRTPVSQPALSQGVKPNSKSAVNKSAVNLPKPTWKIVQTDVTVPTVKWKIPPSLTAINPISLQTGATAAVRVSKDVSLVSKEAKEAAGPSTPNTPGYFHTSEYR
jgi:SLT domain-containing protein